MFNDLYDSGQPRRSNSVKSEWLHPWLETYKAWQVRVLIYFLPIMGIVDIFS